MADIKHIMIMWDENNFPINEIKAFLENSHANFQTTISINGWINENQVNYLDSMGVDCIRTFDQKTFFILKERP